MHQFHHLSQSPFFQLRTAYVTGRQFANNSPSIDTLLFLLLIKLQNDYADHRRSQGGQGARPPPQLPCNQRKICCQNG